MPGDRVGAIILGRLDSRRLPRKLLTEIGGKTLLAQVASRIPAELLDGPVVLATSDRAVDDDLADEARRLGLTVYRGSADDVAGRFSEAARSGGYDLAFRINGDSPFLDPGLMREACAAIAPDTALVTNIAPRSYPYGVAVELVRLSAFDAILGATTDSEDREHVTRALYRDLPPARIRNLTRSDVPDVTGVRLTVDTPEDLDRLLAYVASAGKPLSDLTWRDALESDFYRATG